MYGQYQHAEGSAAKWIFFGCIVIVLMSIALGINIKDAKWFNPDIAAAEANLIDIDAEHKKATYELQERLVQAKTEAEIREIERQQGLLDAQYQRDILALSQDLAHDHAAFNTWMTIVTIFGGALAVTLPLSSTIWVGSRALVYIRSALQKGESVMKSVPPVEKRIPNVPEREPYDPWNSPSYRRSKRIAAQKKERNEREEIAARMMKFRDPGHRGTADYKKRPQVE